MDFYFILFFPLTTHLIATTVSYAEIQPINRTMRAGELFELVQREELQEFFQLRWMKTPFGGNKTVTIVTYDNKGIKLNDSYRDRAVFNNKTFSLTLKNLQKTDSGLYCTTTIGKKTLRSCLYNLFVENHGSPTNIFLPWILFTSTISTMIF